MNTNVELFTTVMNNHLTKHKKTFFIGFKVITKDFKSTKTATTRSQLVERLKNLVLGSTLRFICVKPAKHTLTY